ncbi:MAG: MgtC/SapB family protein [Clostridiales bacterium]
MLLGNREIIIRLLASFIIGLLMGRERKIRNKPVGARTHILVCLASTLITIVSAYGFKEFAGIRTMDPARLIVGVLTGMGFIGAGIIWKDNYGSIQGITTAANVFLCACIGIAIGLGHYLPAFLTVLLAIITLEGPAYSKKILSIKKNIIHENALGHSWNYDEENIRQKDSK